MRKNLEALGQSSPDSSDYTTVGKQTDHVILNFTNIQGNGLAYVYVKTSANVVFRVSSISLFDVGNLSEAVYWNFNETDEIAVTLVGYSPDTIFRATVEVVDAVDPGEAANNADAILALTIRVNSIEERLATVGTGGNTGGSTGGGDTTVIETKVASLQTSLGTLESTVSSLQTTVNTNYTTLDQRLTTQYNALDTRINNLANNSGSGGGTSNVIQRVVASSGSSTKTLDASLYDRYDIVGDANATLNVINLENTSQNERSLAVAALTTVAGTARTYQGVDVWLSSGGTPPYANESVGFGELIYLTNIHGAVIGKYISDVQYKYHTPVPDGVLGNFPFAQDEIESPSLASGSYFASVENMTFVNTGGFKADAPVSGKGAAIKLDMPGNGVKSFQLWFTLASLSTSGFQKLFTVLEDATNNLSYTIEEVNGNLRIRYRNASLGLTTASMLSASANTPYVLTVVTTLGTTNSINVYLLNRTTGVETTWSLSSWPFTDRRDEDSTIQLAGSSGNDNPLLTNGLIRAFVAYDHTISLDTKAKVTQKYL